MVGDYFRRKLIFKRQFNQIITDRGQDRVETWQCWSAMWTQWLIAFFDRDDVFKRVHKFTRSACRAIRTGAKDKPEIKMIYQWTYDDINRHGKILHAGGCLSVWRHINFKAASAIVPLVRRNDYADTVYFTDFSSTSLLTLITQDTW